MIKSVAYCTSYVVSIILPQVHIIWVFVNDMLRVFTGTIEKLSVEILLSIEILLLIFFFELPEKYLKFGGRLKCHLCTSYKTRCRENMARWAIHFAKKHFFLFFWYFSRPRHRKRMSSKKTQKMGIWSCLYEKILRYFFLMQN